MSFDNLDYEKINNVLMDILERKYSIKIKRKVIKKEDYDGSKNKCRDKWK